MKRALCLVLFAILAVGASRAPAQELHPRMRFTREQKKWWIEAYNKAPRAYIDPALKPRRDSKDLLQYLQYTPSERDQGSCGNCWQWAGTGCMEISHMVQNGVKDRLSIQYFNSCETSVIAKDCCAGGWLEDVAAFYSATKIAVPWSNTNAFWQDGDASCDTACDSIAVSPSYGISSITSETIPTQGVGQETAIENIQNVLDQNKPVFFAFFLANDADWEAFRAFWNNDNESLAFNYDPYCNHTPDAGEGGHAVLCVGYNDDDPEDRYWVMLNSWGTTAGRPSGLFRVSMDIDYSCADTDPTYTLYFQALNITFGGAAPTPTPTPNPATMGSISVNTEPVTGAWIYLDYFDMGQVTNSILAMVSQGLHAVWVDHPSYPPQAPQTGVQVNAGAVTSVAFQLKDVSQTGGIAVESAPEKGAAIYLDYRDTGQVTDAALDDVGPGTHFVAIRKAGVNPPGVVAAEVLAGATTTVVFGLPPAGACPISVASVPTGADIYLDYITTGQLTDDMISGVGYGIHDVTVRKGGYLIPPAQTVELSASTCSTSLVFQLLAIPTPSPTPTITPTPFPDGLRVWLNQATLSPGDTFQVSVSFTNTILDWDGYVVIVNTAGRAWSIQAGNRLVEEISPIVEHAMEIHTPFGPVEVLSMRIPYGVPGHYGIYAAILPAGTKPTIQNARGPYSQLAVEPAQVLY